MKNPLTVSDKLQRRLNRLGYDCGQPQRIRAGHWQRSSGCWSWWAECRNRRQVGCMTNMTECLKMSDADLKREMEQDF